MRISKTLRNAILIFLALCEALFGASQSALALSVKELPEDAVVIGLIDSGVAPYHLDETHVLAGKNYVFGSADTVDRIGHGTKTAGMILGSTDGSVHGTCPDAFLVPLVVVDKYPSGVTCNGGTETLVAAIYDAVDVFGCRIINISLCTNEDSEELRAAVGHACEKGVIVVCAAGNYGDDGTLFYPAHYDNVITVGSSAGTQIAGFSQTQDTDFFYEGESVAVVSYKKNGKTGSDSGTSYSCACVAGLCASLLAEDPSLSMDGVCTLLRSRCIEGTSILQSGAAAPAGSFRDIDGNWAQTQINYCIAEGIFSENGGGLFLPDEKMTRAMFVTALWNLAGKPESENGAGFSDVAQDAWYSKAIDWAYENGLVKGISAAEFAPDSFVSREQVCVFLIRYAAFAGQTLKGESTVSFSDEDSISNWAKADVASCASADVIHGYPDHSFRPGGDVTRAECCAVLQNYCLAGKEP